MSRATDDLYAHYLWGGLCRGHAQFGQEAAVIVPHPFLGQQALVVVSENTDHFPLEVLPGGLDWTDGRVGEEAGRQASY